MVSSDLNAVRLILTALQLEGWQQDLPQLVRGALARQRHGHWDLTTANAWGVLAMERFSERFEAGDLTGTTRVGVAGQDRVVDWDSPLRSDSLLLAWPPGSAELAVEHQGAGKPWLSVQGLAALPLKEPLSSGYTLRKTVSAVERRDPDRWSRGDVLRVRIEIEAQADMTWVAVSDPVPAGGVILGAGLGRDSRLLAPDEERRPRLRPAYEERSFEAFRAYYEVAPRGRWAVEYALRLNQPGTFSLPPTRVEALYAPEVFGEIPNERIEVLP
jgi:alpha-2-macroglobulin